MEKHVLFYDEDRWGYLHNPHNLEAVRKLEEQNHTFSFRRMVGDSVEEIKRDVAVINCNISADLTDNCHCQCGYHNSDWSLKY